ncbi:Spo0E like sporulation regulatory protein [Natranaerovirga pectinivora]|uniref:Spo0E like sporulation regulatory protein n=1 Tax=Natranaerovirga pectinivora TaxID=682400 RepID=A0A4R3MNH9_9FIRM|nr:aspartyl-phosphate phosphatase Spo0E family protein [Natranaerovirga pectinivora]TCT14920.1 Spo0E like sporulation regulatory protein [Natranaerovirga pectinivora]
MKKEIYLIKKEIIMKEIEVCKEKLNRAVNEFGCNSNITIQISQDLDILINKYYEYQQIRYGKKNA